MILITGATGTSGVEIVKLLSQRGVKFRALVRNPSKAEAISGLPGVQIVKGDLSEPASLAPALEGVERALFLSSPAADQAKIQGNFIDAAKRAGVRHVVKFSAGGASPESPASFLRWHGETERQLEASGMSWTHLRPNQFMQNFLGLLDMIRQSGTLHAPMKEARMGLVDVRDIAAVSAAALTGPGHEGKVYEITGPESISYATVAEKLSNSLGQPVQYVDTPLEAYRSTLRTMLPEAIADGITELYAGWREGSADVVTDVVQKVGGKTPFSFDEFARDLITARASA